jgi:hypothetical protein
LEIITNDPVGIIKAGYPTNYDRDIQVASVQSLTRRLNQCPEFDLIIVDEAHHSTANSYRTILNRFPARVLGVTATPIRLDGKQGGFIHQKKNLLVHFSELWLLAPAWCAKPSGNPNGTRIRKFICSRSVCLSRGRLKTKQQGLSLFLFLYETTLPLVKITGDTHKLAVTASKRWMMVYDNVIHISNDESDDLCRLATGFGYSTRTLHTTDEETTFEFTRPQIITAIDALASRDDLADRVILAQLGEISENKRLPYAELQQKIEAARPRILGAMLTIISQTLAEMPHTHPERLPRMADYAKLAIE